MKTSKIGTYSGGRKEEEEGGVLLLETNGSPAVTAGRVEMSELGLLSILVLQSSPHFLMPTLAPHGLFPNTKIIGGHADADGISTFPTFRCWGYTVTETSHSLSCVFTL